LAKHNWSLIDMKVVVLFQVNIRFNMWLMSCITQSYTVYSLGNQYYMDPYLLLIWKWLKTLQNLSVFKVCKYYNLHSEAVIININVNILLCNLINCNNVTMLVLNMSILILLHYDTLALFVIFAYCTWIWVIHCNRNIYYDNLSDLESQIINVIHMSIFIQEERII